MADLVIDVAAKVAECLFAPITRHLGYLFNYRSNILSLTEQFRTLHDSREGWLISVAEANRQGDQIFPDVEKWLSRAQEIIEETHAFLEAERDANRGCFNLKLRYQQSKKASGQAGDIGDILNKIHETVMFGRVAHRPPPIGSSGIGSSFVSGYEIFESRGKTLNNIMEALRDDSTRKIGVWGMGGVGKTTLVQQVAELARVAKQANDENLFDIVVMALNISQTPNVTKIQGEIASMLGLKLEERDETERAVRLSQSLKKHKKILVILDDIWEPIAFKKIGIPYGSDDHRVGYCKVLLTSRDRHVLSKDMSIHKEFHVQHLSEEEAWSLFRKTAGDSVETPELQPIAVDVVKKCEGLPVAIVTIAKALTGESVAVWSDALQKLRRSSPTNIRGVSKNVYSCLELSYNHLESKEVKSLFLLCGLLGDGDISLDDLLKYGMGLNLFDDIDSLAQARNRVVSLVEILKASSLLLDPFEDGHYYERGSIIFAEEDNGFVRMHDVVRDVCKAIGSKDYGFAVKEAVGLQGGWQQWVHELGNCTRISLNCIDICVLPGGLVCPKLQFFLVNGDRAPLKIPDAFFKEMKELRVLRLFGIWDTLESSSLHVLSNLTTLCLYNCNIREGIKILGELKKLQILSFEGLPSFEDHIVLPKEMSQLTNLRMLTLRGLIFDPENVISSLSQLQYLCIEEASSLELIHLSCLRALELTIPASSGLLLDDVSVKNLTRYDICIGQAYKHTKCMDDNQLIRTSSRLILNGVDVPHLVRCFSRLLKTVEVLNLTGLNDTKHFFNELGDGFPKLKYLSISLSGAMQDIINTMDEEWVDPPHSAFPRLEELRLRDLEQLQAVWRGPIRVSCFTNLRALIIVACKSLKYIIWLPTTQARESVLEFPQLGSLKLEGLANLLNFYSTGASGSQEPCSSFFNQVALPRLESLHLKSSLDNVRTMWDSQDPVGCFQNLNSLRISGLTSLKYIFPASVVKGLKQLEDLSIRSCGVEEIVANENGVEAVPMFEFPSLTSLDLCGLGQLKRFYREKYTLSCPLLKKLYVERCDKVELLFQEKCLEGELDEQPLFLIEKSTFPNVEELMLSFMGPMEIWRGQFSRESFGKLRVLEIKMCEGIPVAIPCSKLPVLQNLEQLNVQDCNSVEEVIQEEGLAGETIPRLTEIYLYKLPSLMHLSGLQPILQNLHSLDVDNCGNLMNLVSPSMAKRLVQLKVLSITYCSMVKEIVGADVSEATDDISFTNLEKLQLVNLVVLESFSSASNTFKFPSLEKVEIKQLPRLTHLYKIFPGLGQNLQKLRILEVSGCGNLEILLTPAMAKALGQLEKLTVRDCETLKEIVENGGEAMDDEIVNMKLQKLQLCNLPILKSFCSASYTFKFPSLEEVEIKQLPRLTHLYKIIPGLGQNLQKLRILEVSGCGNLEILLTLAMAKALEQLERLFVGDCETLKEIVENGGEATDDEIVNMKLGALALHDLPILKSFCSASYTFKFPSLTHIWITGCPQMEYFCMGHSMTPRLEKMYMNFHSRHLENDLNTIIRNYFTEWHPKEEDSQEEVSDEEDVEEGDS